MRTGSLFVACVLIALAGRAEASDAHYWSHAHGTRSGLLGGLVISGPDDSSAAFYNPGALAGILDPRLHISVDVYPYSRITLEDGIGTPDDLQSQTLVPTPTLTAALVRIPGLDGHVGAFSILTRNRFQGSVYGRVETMRDLISSWPGEEIYVGEFNLQTDLNETWAGFSWSHLAGGPLMIGASLYLAIRSQTKVEERFAEAYAPGWDAALTSFYREFDLLHFRMLLKVGAVLDLDPFRVGLTVTTPGITIWGRGTVRMNLSILNQDLDGDGNVDTRIANDRQSGLDVNYRSPLSVGLGASWDLGIVVLYAAAEWFDGVPRDKVMDAAPRTALTPDAPLDLDVSNRMVSVINVGTGLEWRLTPDVSIFGSIRSDFSALQEAGDSDMAMGSWDLSHVTAGAMLRSEFSELFLGFSYAFGSGSFEQGANFSEAAEENALLGTTGTSSIHHHIYKVMIGYTYRFR